MPLLLRGSMDPFSEGYKDLAMLRPAIGGTATILAGMFKYVNLMLVNT